ncbi:MAG: hypothetical protein ACOY9J_00705 [Pseudomonadota bacterium]
MAQFSSPKPRLAAHDGNRKTRGKHTAVMAALLATASAALVGCGGPVDVQVQFVDNPMSPGGSQMQKVHVIPNVDVITVSQVKINGDCSYSLERTPDSDPTTKGIQLAKGDEIVLGASGCMPLKEVVVQTDQGDFAFNF